MIDTRRPSVPSPVIRRLGLTSDRGGIQPTRATGSCSESLRRSALSGPVLTRAPGSTRLEHLTFNLQHGR